MPFPLAAALTAGGSIAAGLINHFSNKSLANNAYRHNLHMWHEQNAYNSPASQVARLQAAGLNPALAYGGSSQVVGNSQEAPQLDYGGVMQQPLISPDFSMQVNEAMNMQSNRQLQQSQKDLNDAQTIEVMNKAALSGAEKNFAKEYAEEKLRSMRLTNDKTYQDAQKVSQEINNLIATRNLTKEQISALMYANEFADRTMEFRIEATQLMPAETRKRMSEIDSKIKNYSALNAQIYEAIKTARINNSMLPQILQNNLDKGIQEIQNLKQTERHIMAMVDNVATKTGLDRTELYNYYWIHSPNITKVPGAAAGAALDHINNTIGNVPSY